MLIEGQIVGGCAQGIGGTLFEEFLYDERGEPLSVTLADYLMPTVREMPPIEVLICEDAPSPLNPMGLKGAGEGGANAVGAAIAAAIDDALGSAQRSHRAADHAATAQAPATARKQKLDVRLAHDLFRKPASTFGDHALRIFREKHAWTSSFKARRRW